MRLRFAFLGFMLLMGCRTAEPLSSTRPLLMNGAGATFPFPLYSRWFYDYGKTDPTSLFNYQSIGSGGGIRQVLEQTIDFGASDVPMSQEKLDQAPLKIIHVPTVLGAVVLTYALPTVHEKLRLNPSLIAEIFLGKITQWDDPRLKKVNPGLELPHLPLVVVRRSDGSGTTAVLSEYLSKTNPEWRTQVGHGTSVNWPVGLGGKGNEGVAGLIQQVPGSIGYLELLFAKKNALPSALIQNQAGRWVEPTVASVSAAAEAFEQDMPADFRMSITDPPPMTEAGQNAYPLCSFTYLLLPQQMSLEMKKKMRRFIHWAFTQGQSQAEELYYVPLPSSLVQQVESRLDQLFLNGHSS